MSKDYSKLNFTGSVKIFLKDKPGVLHYLIRRSGSGLMRVINHETEENFSITEDQVDYVENSDGTPHLVADWGYQNTPNELSPEATSFLTLVTPRISTAAKSLRPLFHRFTDLFDSAELDQYNQLPADQQRTLERRMTVVFHLARRR